MNFYGVRSDPPTPAIIQSFGSSGQIILLEGGQKTTYRSGEIVLKPTDNIGEAEWCAELFSSLTGAENVRFARPIKANDGKWVNNNYVAWEFLKGDPRSGQYDRKLISSKAFHQLLKSSLKPSFLDSPRNSWSAADKIIWDGGPYDYDGSFLELINKIIPRLRPLNLPMQLIHGDLSGNFLFDEYLSPAIIDFSPVWAPDGFAEGILLVDAITWENASDRDLKAFHDVASIDQFAWRGALRRILEQAEHIKWLAKPASQALQEAKAFQKAIDYLNKHFS